MAFDSLQEIINITKESGTEFWKVILQEDLQGGMHL